MRIRARDVAEYVAAEHRLSFPTFISDCRERQIARPRQIAMYAIKRLCPHMSYPAIGRMLGGRDHTTVLHGVRKIDALIRIDPDIARAVSRVLSHFAEAQERALEVPVSGFDPICHAVRFQALCASYGQAMRDAA